MSESFDQLVEDAISFFGNLKSNNNRDWFHAHKGDYDAKIKKPAGHLADVVADRLHRETERPYQSKIFRQHRDVRFSKDKTPYNTHLHMLWKDSGGAEDAPGYFLGISPDYVSVGAGVMAFAKTRLDAYREAMDGPEGERLNDMTNALLADGFRMDEPALKRVPKPFDPDHRNGELLRRKGVVVWHDIGANRPDGLLETALKDFRRLTPMVELLRRI